MDRKQEWKEKISVFFDKYGFHALLLGCIAIVGATAFLTLRAPQQEQAEEQEVRQSEDESLEEARFPFFNSPEPSETPQATPQPTAAPTPTPVPSANPNSRGSSKLFPAPLEGEVIKDFSGDALLYSRTLDQWVTHGGIDIGAEEGVAVLCIAQGVVSKVYEDEMLGYCVIVSHEGSYESTYANLQKMSELQEGQSIATGDQIGRVGKSALSECEDPSHLHFELRYKNKAVDPRAHLMGVSTLPETK